MRHKHHDLIVAKAANMDLVVFSQNQKDGSWLIQNDQGTTDFGDCVNYFLCLPQHEEACLHWLNGGGVESLHKDYEPMTLAECGSIAWGVKSTFMKDSIEIRIKPKKEKRWIAYSANQKRLGCLSFDSEQEVRAHYIHEVEEPQFIEIEVEVKNGQNN